MENSELQLAYDFVKCTNQNLFLTGRDHLSAYPAKGIAQADDNSCSDRGGGH